MNKRRGRPQNTLSLIRIIRNAMGLTARELAKLANTDYYAVQRIESNRTIGAERVYKLAKALDISADIIFYSMGQIPEDKVDLVKKDPLRFKEIIDKECKEPWRLTKTTDYMKDIQNKMEQSKINPEITKVLSKLKPSESEANND